MEFKNYFKKFGKGWVVLGLVMILLFFVSQIIYLFEKENTIRAASAPSMYNQSVSEFLFSKGYVQRAVLESLLLGFIPFIVGFLGLIRLFWLLIAWEGVFLLSRLFFAFDEFFGILGFIGFFVIPLLIIMIGIGIIWEVIHHIKLKKQNINQ